MHSLRNHNANIHPSPPGVSETMQVWSSKMGAASKEVELLESLIPHDRREMALALFHENDCKINGKLFKDRNIRAEYLSPNIL